jgi:RimJ/RimL family protein N-acetyltransferase
MNEPPTIETERLVLRPFALEDAADVRRLAGDRAIADTTLLIPHPYPEGVAEEWIRGHRDLFRQREAAVFAVTARETGALIGAIGLQTNPRHGRAELGYWIGRPFWNQGFATEAARAVVRYGFDELHLHRVYAHHMTRNPASGRVLEKVGMRLEGELRDHVAKWGKYETLRCYAILNPDGSD